MSVPHFLTIQDVLAVHAAMLDRYGGAEGVLNMGLLESALLAPQASWGGRLLNAFPYEVAAAYLVGFARNHSFADGNKRTASGTAVLFLAMNKVDLVLTPGQLVALTLGAAVGKITKEKVAYALENGL